MSRSKQDVDRSEEGEGDSNFIMPLSLVDRIATALEEWRVSGKSKRKREEKREKEYDRDRREKKDKKDRSIDSEGKV